MKALFIGGTGVISTPISRKMVELGWDLYLLNRGTRSQFVPEGAKVITADINDEENVTKLLKGMEFDLVVDFIAFTQDHVERDYRLFSGRTKQYIFISSASVYQKPLSDYRINEGTPLANPYWLYSRNKIACEDFLMKQYRENGFPITIVRPSHTYGERRIPVGVEGDSGKGSWQVIKRMLDGKPVIIHGDGLTLWTMTHVSDFTKGFIGLVDNIHAIGEAVQITSDESLTWNQIYEKIADALGVKLNAVHISSDFLAACGMNLSGKLLGDKANTVVFDNSKLKRLVPGFTATMRFDQGVKSTVRWVLDHPEFQLPDPEFDKWCDKVIAAWNYGLSKFKE